MSEYTNQQRFDPSKIYKNPDWGKSETVPNQAMPLKELAERVRDGRPVPSMQLPIQPPPLGGEPQFSDADYAERIRLDPLLAGDEMLTEHTKLSNKIKADKKKAADAQAATQKTKDQNDPENAEAEKKGDGKE